MKKVKCINCNGTGYIEVEDGKHYLILLGQKIKDAREKKGLTQNELAQKIGFSRTSLINVEQGRQNVHVARLLQIAGKLDMPIGELVP